MAVVSFDTLQEFNRDVKDWANLTKQKLLFRLTQLDLQERVRLAGEISLRKSLKEKFKTSHGQVESVGFSFARHGIFLERGVGRGVKLADVAASNRMPKIWLAAVLPNEIERLADIIAENYADDIAGEIKINIPGVMQTKVKL